MAEPDGAQPEWFVYLLECSDGSLYTGISTDVERRFREHRAGRRGARFFRGREPLAVAWIEGSHTRSSASRREAAIKRLGRAAKLALIRERAGEMNPPPSHPPRGATAT